MESCENCIYLKIINADKEDGMKRWICKEHNALIFFKSCKCNQWVDKNNIKESNKMNKDCNNCKYQDEMTPHTCDICTSLDEDDYCM